MILHGPSSPLLEERESRLVEIIVNGEPRQAPPGATVEALLQELGLAARHVAVELNLQLVPRGLHAQQRLAAGDRLEVVTLVGGG